MLYRLEVENFYSIRDQQVIDLVARQDVTEFDRVASVGPSADIRVPKVISVFGANASGKSNLLKALSFLTWFVSSSFEWRPGTPLPFSRFLDEKSESEPTRIAVEFAGPQNPDRIGEGDEPCCRYAYEVVFGGQKGQPVEVLQESLKYWQKSSKKPTNLFQRDQSGKVTGNEIFGLSEFQSPLEKVLRNNASVISTLCQLKHPIATRLWRMATQVAFNVFIEKIEWTHDQFAGYYTTNPHLLPALNREIERVDFGIKEIAVAQTQRGPIINVQHNGLSSVVPWMYESHGTRQFVMIFPLIMQALECGSIAIIDELDQSIHPMVLQEIIHWFYDPERNKHNAQLWFSAQNPSLLEGLTKEEILFCEKDRRGRTSVYGLNDIKSVRRNDNFYRKYLSGIYGGVPHIE
jgi:AAA15 family ATPase/GTPase